MNDEELVHELAQPLQVISMISDRLRRQPEAAVQKAAIQIMDQVGRIAHIVRGTRAPERTPTDLNKLIHEALDLVCMTCRPDNVEVVVDLVDTITLNIDRLQIEQVLVNLMRNAFEALSQRGDRLVIRSSLTENQIEVAVIDNGPGIDGNVMPRLFRPYATSKQGGMGIGLTISEHIVRAHDGRITVTTSDNGTCFVITLPC